jgi:hypothetical protein
MNIVSSFGNAKSKLHSTKVEKITKNTMKQTQQLWFREIYKNDSIGKVTLKPT